MTGPYRTEHLSSSHCDYESVSTIPSAWVLGHVTCHDPSEAWLAGDHQTGIMPRVKSVGYVYFFDPSVFFKMFCSVLDTSGSEDARARPRAGRKGARKE